MNILLTTLELESYSGLPLYTRDIALELKRQGHRPEVYTLKKGKVSDELVGEGIPVADNPAQIQSRPDIIHGQHRVSTLIAIKQFRTTPALFICHNHTFWGDEAPFHPRILLYLGVSQVCIDRLKKDGVPENKIVFLANFVDTNRFLPRPNLPDKPKKALVFSNYANDHTHLPVVREACRQVGLDMDVVGIQTHYVTNPESILGNYDIIFAKAKAAIESMATGNAVVLCDFSGVGPMVTSDEFHKLRLMNFGFQTLTKPLEPQNIIAEIARYDPKDTIKVRDLIRTSANLENAAKNILLHYESVIKQYQDSKSSQTAKGKKLSFWDSLYWERARFWASLTPFQKKILRAIAEHDPSAKEHIYIFSRDVTVQKKSKASIRGTIITLARAIVSLILRMRFWPYRVWMIIPRPARTCIKKLPFARKALDLLKRVLLPNQK